MSAAAGEWHPGSKWVQGRCVVDAPLEGGRDMAAECPQ